jgi:hypothetical protein
MKEKKWLETLRDCAENSEISEATKLLNNHRKEILKEFRENYSKFKEDFKEPYNIAYDNEQTEFCIQYENTIDKLIGLESSLFLDE